MDRFLNLAFTKFKLPQASTTNYWTKEICFSISGVEVRARTFGSRVHPISDVPAEAAAALGDATIIRILVPSHARHDLKFATSRIDRQPFL
jgi:hypothetical protein